MAKFQIIVTTRSGNTIGGVPKELTDEEYTKAKEFFQEKLSFVSFEDGEGGHFIVQGTDISFVQLKKVD